ncbi:MAG: penicillin-binding protein 1A [Gammaproteobacteria bacterium]
MRILLMFLRFGVVLAAGFATFGAAAMLGAYLYLAPGLPSVASLKDIQLQTPLRVYTREGELMAVFGEKRRKPLSLQQVPMLMQRAFLAAEDDRFYTHPGVDYHGLLRAAWQLLSTGEKQQGGSTITMQLARNFFLTSERTYERKLREVFLALKMERELSKHEILELYLNKIYLGNRAYGVGAAAEVYYGLDARELNLSQIAIIAGLPKAPSIYNPIADPAHAIERRNYVLQRMHDLHFIDDKDYQIALRRSGTARLHDPAVASKAPYVAEMARMEMISRFGLDAYTGGYKVKTTVSADKQRAAAEALRAGLEAYDKRHGYRGAEQRIGPDMLADRSAWRSVLADYPPVAGLGAGLVINVGEKSAKVYAGGGKLITLSWEDLSWARPYINQNAQGGTPDTAADVLARGDIVRIVQNEKGGWGLTQLPDVSGALVSLDPRDGAIVALVGGLDFNQSNFNRATQAYRQPGSAFKPFIYSAALEHGFTPASTINDAPVVFDASGLENIWRPENYGGTFYGPTRMRVALAQSRNMVSIRLLSSMGLSAAMDHISKFGFDASRLPMDLSLALGSGSVTPLELAAGYAVFANGGFRISPYLIESIKTVGGKTVFRANPPALCESAACQPGAAPPLSADNGTLAVMSPAKTATDSAAVAVQRADERRDTVIYPRDFAPRALPAANAYQMVSMMKDVISTGTGAKAMALNRTDLAGKTGTTNDQHDAWFSGYNTRLVTTVWLGFDNPRPMGDVEVGGAAALPVWIDYMRVALRDIPESNLPQPAGMVTVRIDPQTGLLASSVSDDGIFETFRSDQVPRRGAMAPAPVYGRSEQQPVEVPEQLF